MVRTVLRRSRTAIVAALSVWLALPPGGAVGTIIGSPHDFSAVATITPAGSCSACHIPHNSPDSYALWPRDLSPYRSALALGVGSPNYIHNPTVSCYDCHDYHEAGGGESFFPNNVPAINDFPPNHKPQNILFGFQRSPASGYPATITEDGYGNSTYDIPGYYENTPPYSDAGANFGANPSLNVDNADIVRSGGHYFKRFDPDGGGPFEKGDKLPCRDCHDPHESDGATGSWQAFIRKNNWPSGSQVATQLGTTVARGSTFMANEPAGGVRDDDDSRKLCAMCHGYSDAWDNVSISHVNTAYSSGTGEVSRPPNTVSAHAYNGGNGPACVSCHGHNSVEASCTGCHGFPPNPYPPARTATPPASYTSRDPHAMHVGHADGQPAGSFPSPATNLYRFDCRICHATSELGSRTQSGVHGDNTMDLAYDLSELGVGNPPDVTSAGALTCSNVFCHSNGGPDNAAVVQGGYYTPVQWGMAAAPLRCNGCHGSGKSPLTLTPDNTITTGMPNYASGAPGSATANSHAVHVDNNQIGCTVCHYDTVVYPESHATGRSVNASPRRHLNGARDVVFDTVNAAQRVVVGSGTGYDNAAKRCDVSCHGIGRPLAERPQWGGSLTNGCFACHGGLPEGFNKPQDNVDYPNPVDNTQYVQSGHGRATTYPVSNNPGAGKWDNSSGRWKGCYASDTPNAGCHDAGAPHFDNTSADPFRLGASYKDNTVALCLTCHGASGPAQTRNMQQHSRAITGSARTWPGPDYEWKCVDCHDPHGDGTDSSRRIDMVRSAINQPTGSGDTSVGSDTKGRPRRAPGWTGISFYDNQGFAPGSYAVPGTGLANSGICEGCHTQTTPYSQMSDNTGTHTQRTASCLTCHPHDAGFAPKACRGCHGPDGTQPNAPNVGNYWASSGHGRTGINVACEACHDVGYLTGTDHKTNAPGFAPLNINTEYWPGKPGTGSDNVPNANTAHLRSGFINTSPASRADIARTFDAYCRTQCHQASNPPPWHHNKNTGPNPDVVRFGDPANTPTTTTPKAYTWYSWTTSDPANYATNFYRSLSPWIDNDIRAQAGLPDASVAYGVCVSCHDPHGTDPGVVTDRTNWGTNAMLRGNWVTDSAGFCTVACHR